VSSTLSDTGAAATAAGTAAAGTRAPEASVPETPLAETSGGARSRPHIIAFDLIRLIIMVFVVGVHTLAFAGGQVNLVLGAVTTVFHTSRELFIMLTALVLTYNYGHRPRLGLLRFWRRRYWLVLPAYLTWSAIYYAFDGAGRGPFPAAFLHDLETADARYHLYFLLVSMQMYLLFPAFRWLLRKTEGHHRWLLAAALAYQIWLTCALHYHVGRIAAIGPWINGAGQGYWLESYVLYFVAGALAGWHFERLCAVTRRLIGSVRRIAVVASLGVAAGVGVYLTEIYAFGATPGNASAVFQPVVIVEAITFGLALLAGGLLWSDRGAPGRKFCAAGSASSFGIYLAHPLVLQGLLAVTGAGLTGGLVAGGLLGAVQHLPSGLELLVLLFLAVPVVYSGAWVLSSAARRTPASLPLTGREYTGKKGTRTGKPAEAGR
jgi:peptidoglycan/LPS O-acetylase OafA/YrhL